VSKGIKVVKLEKDAYTVSAVAADRKDDIECQLTDFLGQCWGNPKYRGSVEGLQGLIERFSVHGRSGLTSDQSHYADKANEIYQFKKGDLRVLYFYASDKSIVICSHGFLKKSQKADKKEVRTAVKLRNSYLDSGTIEFLDQDNC